PMGARSQAGWHLLLLLAPLAAFAVGLAFAGSPVPVLPSLLPADRDFPGLAVLALLALAVGVPFLVLSTTAPLLQRWFAATGLAGSRAPYFLSAASNAGSLLGLLGYPFLVEAALPLAQQQRLWAAAVAGCLALIAACALATLSRGSGVR